MSSNVSNNGMSRCAWVGRYVGAGREEYMEYHDEEWGVPVVSDDRLMFEMISLEGAQAGLSWATVLAKRRGYEEAFDDFQIDVLVRRLNEASSTEELIDEVMKGNYDIVRSRRKIGSIFGNAAAAKKIQEE
ncbi:hypothetical protein FOL47_001782 [Perkinsus chesapeaki]|uniref:DNA-3-methyladenine glycosylase I n=1 Tax=Perkinsus chesapeaki TaxID=330153 RepID=A0A7J6MHB6_PERCH|nr:hypothetical protein FOL47_001782 [Perkinsus chesapeaki]